MTLQISTYVVPLVTLPLLTRVLSPEGYGQLSFALAVITYFINFTNYSFDLTATPRIALARHDRAERSRVFWGTFLAQIAITAVGFVVLLALTFIVPRFALDRTLLMVGFGMTLGAALTPTWYFQGVENLRSVSLMLFGARLLSVPAMFLLVRERSDVTLVMAVNAAVPLTSGVAIFIYMFARREVYASTNTVLLGFVSGNVAAGYFAAGDKLIRAAISMLQPLKAAAYPRVSYLMHNAREDAMTFLRKLFVIQGLLVLSISLVIFFGAPLAVHILYGPTYAPTVGVLRWMAFIPFMAGMTDLFGIQTMLPLGMKTAFSRVLVSSGFLNVALLPLLAKFFAEQGAAAAVLIAESSVAAALAYILYSQGVSLIGRPAPRQ
jgi:PST family polysaccharide transporter